MELLWDELGESRRMVQEEPSNQRLRRHLLYDFCIYNEVSLTSMKQFIISLDTMLRHACMQSSEIEVIQVLHKQYDFRVEPEIMSLLAERQPDSDETGKLRFRQKFLPKLTDVRLTYKTFSRILRLEVLVNFNSGGWDAYRKVIKKRNSVTHASSVEDLQISDEDIEHIVKANAWILSDVCKMQKEGNRKLEGITKLCQELSR